LGTEPNVKQPGAVSPTWETIWGVEIPLVVTPPCECNCISLHFILGG